MTKDLSATLTSLDFFFHCPVEKIQQLRPQQATKGQAKKIKL